MPVIGVRRAVAGDLTVLRRIFRRASLSNAGDQEILLAHPDALNFAGCGLAAGRTRVAVAFDGIIVGFITAVPLDGGALELEDLFVDLRSREAHEPHDPSARNRGCAAGLKLHVDTNERPGRSRRSRRVVAAEVAATDRRGWNYDPDICIDRGDFEACRRRQRALLRMLATLIFAGSVGCFFVVGALGSCPLGLLSTLLGPLVRSGTLKRWNRRRWFKRFPEEKTMNFEWRSDPGRADPAAREGMQHHRTVTGEATTTVFGRTR